VIWQVGQVLIFSWVVCIGKSSIRLSDIRDAFYGQYRGWIALYEPDSPSDIPTGLLRVRIIIEDNIEATVDENSQASRRKCEQLLFDDQFLGESKDLDEDLKVFIGTWNVGNGSPPEDLWGFLQSGGSGLFPMYVLCFQESDIVSGASTNTAEWLSYLQRHFGDGYTCIQKASMWQIRMYIFLRKDLLCHVSGFHICDESTGIPKVLGNKGGIAISFNYKQRRICFVNSHLAAHQEKIDERNEHYREIVENVHVGHSSLDILSQFHHVIWAGDLNYRLNLVSDQKRTPDQEEFDNLIKMIQNQEYERLFAHDQLQGEINSGRAFCSFSEGVLDFPPTFKVEKGQVLQYNTKRLPAWCDRILWNSAPGEENNISLNKFGTHLDITSSDHKPVYACFSLRTPEVPSALVKAGNGDDFRDKFFCLVIKHLRASGLRKITNLSGAAQIAAAYDPFVNITGESLTEKAQSSTISKDTDPEWPDFDLPAIPLKINSRDRLAFEHIVIQVKGQDRLKLRPSSVYGTGRFSLKDLAKSENEWVDIEVKLTRAGIPAGTVYITAQLILHQGLLEAPTPAASAPTTTRLRHHRSASELEPSSPVLNFGGGDSAADYDPLENTLRRSKALLAEDRLDESGWTIESLSQVVEEQQSRIASLEKVVQEQSEQIEAILAILKSAAEIVETQSPSASESKH
jgi:hypothetical protein